MLGATFATCFAGHVVASFLDGGVCVLVTARALLDRGAIEERRLSRARR
jgi:hypothetical protein